ncbi:MAG TPA: biotin--[acetyl-CoA-carboxylase] ligase [Candidatus Omnitrophota bacterium]|nr:biotin--[acetyl-CoA-carboxylase] ligase [Candidatus Omnitrophota bacterium]HQO57793.1 biotin--[acetyl-CoA-carboxylase] ligase [Candidatus Omnitrophota bacterium]HQP11463.1 biotin--[acetyl-CoA-carboxylase] ligase [Candidatus Omnitrophota bacterium]
MILEEIIQYLKSNTTFVSGQKLSQHLKISRAAVWKYIHELRDAGYRIEAVPRRGYHLKSAPDKLLPWEIRPGLGTRFLGQEVFCYETLTSTMDEAFRLAEGHHCREGALVCAETQSQGRGRMGRAWLSPSGKGIYASMILYPLLSPLEVSWITFAAAIAVCEAVRQTTGLKAVIKWPNDILIQRKKVAGILTEMNAEVDRVHFVVIGLGLNVNTDQARLPPQATSLKAELGRKVSRVACLQAVLRRMEYWYDCLLERRFPPLLERWKALSVTLGRRVRISDHHKAVEGRAVDLSDDGGLVVLDAEGDLIKKMTGDVEFLD